MTLFLIGVAVGCVIVGGLALWGLFRFAQGFRW